MINSRKVRNSSLAFAARILENLGTAFLGWWNLHQKKPAIYIYVLGLIVSFDSSMELLAFHRWAAKVIGSAQNLDVQVGHLPPRMAQSWHGVIQKVVVIRASFKCSWKESCLVLSSDGFVTFVYTTNSMGTPRIKERCRKNGAFFLMHSEEQSLFKSYSKTERQWSKMQFLLLGRAWTLSRQRMRCGYFLHSYSICCTEEGWRWLCSKGGSHWQARAFQELGVVE